MKQLLTPARRHLRRQRAAGVLALAVGSIPFTALIQTSIVSAATATGTVSGVVFRDLNDNGVRNVGDGPVADAWVKVTGQAAGPDGILNTSDDVISSVAPVKTDATGAWSAGNVASDSKVRVELLGLDTNNSGTFDAATESRLPSWLQPSAVGTNSASSVQFVPLGATNVDFGVQNPAEYTGTTDPTLVVSAFIFGKSNDNNSGGTTVYSVPYGASGAAGTPLATHGATGAVFGVAVKRSTRDIFTSAFMKRHAGFGVLGPSGVYKNGANYVKLNDLPGFNSAGTDPHPQTTLAAGGDWITDAASYDKVGRISLGDLDISEDETTLYTINLAAKQLVTIPAGTAPTSAAGTGVSPGPGQVGQFDIPSPCAGAQPAGLGVRDGVVYVGGVCTSGPSGYVYSFDPVTRSFSPAPILSWPMTENRGVNADGASETWNPWVSGTTEPATPPTAGGVSRYHAQPLVTDIVVDRGDLLIGVRDRWGDQLGNYANDLSGQRNVLGIGIGEIYRACANGAGAWTLESNGRCGAITTAGKDNGQGVGGGEYYFQDGFDPITGYQNNISAGGLVQIPGRPEVVATFNDPEVIYSGGLRWLNNTTGERVRAATLYQGQATPDVFGKSNGIGDIEALVDAAPVEIGNRVWIDANRNGIQDPAEIPLAGITVTATVDPDGPGLTAPIVVTAVTDVNGNYLFSSAPGTSSTSAIRGVAALVPGATVTLAVPTSTGVAAGVATAGTDHVLTTRLVTDLHLNSDADPATGRTSSFTISGPGANDHTWDFGYAPPLPDGGSSTTTTTPSSTTSVVTTVPGPTTTVAPVPTFRPTPPAYPYEAPTTTAPAPPPAPNPLVAAVPATTVGTTLAPTTTAAPVPEPTVKVLGVTVSSSQPTPTLKILPYTGASSSPLLIIGGVLILFGAALMLGTFRRKPKA